MATYRQKAWDIAVGQHGYITTRDAKENGIPAIELVKLAAGDCSMLREGSTTLTNSHPRSSTSTTRRPFGWETARF